MGTPQIRNTINSSYIDTLGNHFFFVTFMNCDSNVYSHISYKLLQDCDCRKEKAVQNNPLMLE
jgi:hypothetical protein